MFFNFFMWSKVMMFDLPVEETERSITDRTVSMTTCTPAVRRRGHCWQQKHEHQNHGRQQRKPAYIAVSTFRRTIRNADVGDATPPEDEEKLPGNTKTGIMNT